MLQIVWFKRDLRITDHEPLVLAAQHGPVLPLYIVEPELWQQPDVSGRQSAFCRETLHDLRDRLAGLGQPLVVRHGDAVAVLGELIGGHRIAAVRSHCGTGNAWTFARDRRVAALLREHGIPWHQLRKHGIVRGRADRDRWSQQWEALMTQPPCTPPQLKPLPGDIAPGALPELPVATLPSDPCPGRLPGGSASAQQVRYSFLHARQCILQARRMASKPYVASGRYIQRMSNYCGGCRYRPDMSTGDRACPFTTLYWDFLLRHERRFADHPRAGMQWRNLGRLDDAQRRALRATADRQRRDIAICGG